MIIGVIKTIASIIKNIKEVYHDYSDKVIDKKVETLNDDRGKVLKKMENAKDITDEELISLHRILRNIESR